uniref:protein-L-isoaspartate(D-aspartate) O-methyltransferase n=1 Tax=Dermatophagoides pteronyssinus TaxID=6956 RepID=A0A6P6XQB9_DERPT|nr:uncharacterized protein LOC113789691 [Dermatophagoides pteronyssinus]
MNNNSKNLNVHRACSLVDRRHFYGTNINIDKSISIMVGKKNSHSFPLKYEIRLLEYIEPFLRKNSRVLDIGSGMGHLTCLLANLCQFVVGIDNVKELVKKSQEIVAKYYQNLQLCFCKTDGRNGCENYSPYDLILIEPIIRTGTVPEKLFRQLKPNGSIIAIVRFTDEYQQLLQQQSQQQQQQQPQLNRFQLVRFIKMNNLQITLEILCNDHDWLVQNHKDCFQ